VKLPAVYRVSKLDLCFYKSWVCPDAPNYGTIEQMHDAGISVISLLEGLQEKDKDNSIGEWA